MAIIHHISIAGFANIAAATATSYTSAAAITTTTYYRRVATGAGKSYNTNVVIATVNTIPVVSSRQQVLRYKKDLPQHLPPVVQQVMHGRLQQDYLLPL
jgi:hypothetical protein